MHSGTETIIDTAPARYVHELCADMRGFRDGAVYAWFAHAARGWDNERTAAHLAALTTQPVGAPERNEDIYDRVRALARRHGFAVRASDDRALPLRDILVSGGVITVSAYANVTTVQWVILAALFLAQVTVGIARPPDVVAVARTYGAAYGALRALGVDTPNAARALVLEGVPPEVVEDNIDEIARMTGWALGDLGPREAATAPV